MRTLRVHHTFGESVSGQAKACPTTAMVGHALACQRPLAGAFLLALFAAAAFAQPGQLLGPAQQSRMQDSNLKPALPCSLQGVGIDQRLDQQVSLDLMFKDEAGRDVPLSSFSPRGNP